MSIESAVKLHTPSPSPETPASDPGPENRTVQAAAVVPLEPGQAIAEPASLADLLQELRAIRRTMLMTQVLAVGERDLARMLGVSIATLARWKSAGKLLPGIRKGGRILYPLDGPRGVRAWLAAGMPDGWK